MANNTLLKHKNLGVIEEFKSKEDTFFLAQIKNNIWLFGIPSWLFGISDRGIAALADSYLSPIEILHLFTASLFFLAWLYLKPEQSFNSSLINTLQSHKTNLIPYRHEAYLDIAIARMLELREQHMIRQEYILPFPYICQIYHLLNLKHLENIHSFSLSNLKVIKVSKLQSTNIGGKIKFQTTLDSSLNALRIWRQPIVEVDLILHSPYTVELSIPVYNSKKITVIFNVIPLSQDEHKLFIDIYSDLQWCKPLLQVILHFAACLTLFEDLPYLKALAERNIHRLINAGKSANHETMQLYNRFVALYGSNIELNTQALRQLPSTMKNN